MASLADLEVNEVWFQITNRCNWACRHCYQGNGHGDSNITIDDASLVARRTYSPRLTRFMLTGGEARLHPNFFETTRAVHDQLVEEMKDQPPDDPLHLCVFTNGHGMSNPEEIAKITTSMTRAGATSLAVSTDWPHREYADDHNIPVDYETITALSTGGKKARFFKDYYGIPDITYYHGYQGTYILPIGRASSLTWEERIRGSQLIFPDTAGKAIDNVRSKLVYEAKHWSEVETFSHDCVCKVAKRNKALQGMEAGSSPKTTCLDVNPDANVDICGWRRFPPVASLKDQDLPGVLQTIEKSPINRTIAAEGPAGLAKRITSWSEKEIMDRVAERTHCGLCEDLNVEYPRTIKQMMRAE